MTHHVGLNTARKLTVIPAKRCRFNSLNGSSPNFFRNWLRGPRRLNSWRFRYILVDFFNFPVWNPRNKRRQLIYTLPMVTWQCSNITVELGVSVRVCACACACFPKINRGPCLHLVDNTAILIFFLYLTQMYFLIGQAADKRLILILKVLL